MSASEAVTDGLHLSEVPASVGQFLATPGVMSPPRRISGLAGILAVMAYAAAALIFLFGGSVHVELGAVHLNTIDLSQAVIPCIIGGTALLTLCVIVRVWSRSRIIGMVDLRTEVMKATLRMMIKRPRFGVERSTPLVSVMLRAHYLPGMHWEVVTCYSKRYRFTDDDFSGMSAGDFGGADMMAEAGRLIVFGSEEAKTKYLERKRHA